MYILLLYHVRVKFLMLMMIKKDRCYTHGRPYVSYRIIGYHCTAGWINVPLDTTY